ncbi:MAG: hypothetical protein DCC55_22505 [Chloroflexi bacterium]|nr:MAG: hypothetical protein DCC55_22505 [Chloroflexota bacterium]
MTTNTAIEWTNHTWNPWRGCLKVSPGCKACYMYREQTRYGNDPKAIVRAKDATFYAPHKWKEPARVFTCSWSDFFIALADGWRFDAWNTIRATPHLTYQILTKRPENITDRLPPDWGTGWPNVWLGVSVESQDYDGRLRQLAQIPAKVRFVSYEPALGPLNLRPWLYTRSLDWVISGGESGHYPRPADLDWFRSVRDQCVQYGVAYFHKQHGGHSKIDGSYGGHLLDGQSWRQFPKGASNE